MKEARLRKLDEALRQQGVLRSSVHPERSHARSFYELARAFNEAGTSPETQAAIEDLIVALASDIPRHFPENIFWDFDCLCGAIASCAASASISAPNYILEATDILRELLKMFGLHSSIRFRYMHDFIYGYDFEQWEPESSLPFAEKQDFSISFLQAMLKKGRAMERCAARNGAAYPQLAEGRYRNTFSFCREPDSERLLFSHLVRQGLLPLEGWRLDGADVRIAGKKYRPLRNTCARELGLMVESDSKG